MRFTGKERDAETGLDYFGARYLASAQGRFTSPDAPFADQDPRMPQSWNLYSYVRNNPLRNLDHDGRQTVAAEVMKVLAKHEANLAQGVKIMMQARDVKDVGEAIRTMFVGETTVTGKIDKLMQSGDVGERVEGIVAALVENKFGKDVTDVGREIRDSSGKRISQLDIELSFANVEVKSGQHPVDIKQLEKQTNNPLVNPLKKPLFVYAPLASDNQQAKIESTGAKVVRNINDLLHALQRVKESSKK